MKIYGLKNCDTCRHARRWLDANDIAHDFVDLREATPSLAILRQWHAALGDTLLNRRGTTWRQLPNAEKARADHALPELLHEHPALMKRPLLVNGGAILAGFDETTWRKAAG